MGADGRVIAPHDRAAQRLGDSHALHVLGHRSEQRAYRVLRGGTLHAERAEHVHSDSRQGGGAVRDQRGRGVIARAVNVLESSPSEAPHDLPCHPTGGSIADDGEGRASQRG